MGFIPSENVEFLKNLDQSGGDLLDRAFDHRGALNDFRLIHAVEFNPSAGVQLADRVWLYDRRLRRLADLTYSNVARRLLGGDDPDNCGQADVHLGDEPARILLSNGRSPIRGGYACDIADIGKIQEPGEQRPQRAIQVIVSLYSGQDQVWVELGGDTPKCACQGMAVEPLAETVRQFDQPVSAFCGCDKEHILGFEDPRSEERDLIVLLLQEQSLLQC